MAEPSGSFAAGVRRDAGTEDFSGGYVRTSTGNRRAESQRRCGDGQRPEVLQTRPLTPCSDVMSTRGLGQRKLTHPPHLRAFREQVAPDGLGLVMEGSEDGNSQVLSCFVIFVLVHAHLMVVIRACYSTPSFGGFRDRVS